MGWGRFVGSVLVAISLPLLLNEAMPQVFPWIRNLELGAIVGLAGLIILAIVGPRG